MPNIKKSTLLNLRGEQNATRINKSLSTAQIQRVLGVMKSNNLSWKENSNRRATKAMGAFFQIKRSLSQKRDMITKLRAYTGYVVPSEHLLPRHGYQRKRERERERERESDNTILLLRGN